MYMNDESLQALEALQCYLAAKISLGLPTLNGEPVRLDVVMEVLRREDTKEHFHLIRELDDTGKC